MFVINLPIGHLGDPSLDGANRRPARVTSQLSGTGPISVCFWGSPRRPCGEELVQERLFQFGGQRQQPLLLLHRPLHHPQHPRNLPLLGDGRDMQLELS